MELKSDYQDKLEKNIPESSEALEESSGILCSLSRDNGKGQGPGEDKWCPLLGRVKEGHDSSPGVSVDSGRGWS